jgi:FixJ family two-component response regulator
LVEAIYEGLVMAKLGLKTVTSAVEFACIIGTVQTVPTASRASAMRNRTNGNANVYVVDDDLDVREGLKSLFQSVGLSSQAYGSTTEFLTAKLPDEVSCLILDVRLPGLSGLDFQAELARTQTNIPIIFITGYGDIPMSVKAMKGGAVEFLSKPLREQDLLDAVRVALDRDLARREAYSKTRDLRERFNALSSREQQVMGLVCAGRMNKQAAAEIGISEITVKVHRHNVMKKLGAKSLPDLVRMADLLEVPRAK